jgi:repressor LexA
VPADPRPRLKPPVPAPPTERQRRVLNFISAFAAKRGYPPTHVEIAEGLKFSSPNAAREHVRLLAKKGLLTVTPGVSRGLRVTTLQGADGSRRDVEREDGAFESGRLPIIGRVAAGAPILAAQHVEGSVPIDPAAFRPKADYLLRVRGDSMIEAGIFDGDLVAVSRAVRPTPGAIVVVRLDDETTVKRWRRVGDKIRLEPANAALRPIEVDPRRASVVVEGVVLGLVRLGVGR